MSASVLTILEQKASISGKKKKKKTMKNVLSIPTNLKVESYTVEVNEAKRLSQILERLLPSARLPVPMNTKSSQDFNELQLFSEAKSRRNQLSLGVNALNRSIKKDLISTVLFASDIEPKCLNHHLCLLCNDYKIPFLHLPGLREITKSSLGFPCIAVGLKKNSCDFSAAIEEIQTLFQTKKVTLSESCLETAVESSESDEDEILKNELHIKLKENDETPFTYLYRTSLKERIFIPEKINDDLPTTESKSDFLVIMNADTESKSVTKSSHLGISSRFIKSKGKLKNLKELESSETDDDDDDDDDDNDLEVCKKKVKKDWVIDKVGNRQNIRYYPANLMRVPSNPDRMRKK